MSKWTEKKGNHFSFAVALSHSLLIEQVVHVKLQLNTVDQRQETHGQDTL